MRLLLDYQRSGKSLEISQNLVNAKFWGDVHGLHVGPSQVYKGTDLRSTSTSSNSSVQKMDNTPGKAKMGTKGEISPRSQELEVQESSE